MFSRSERTTLIYILIILCVVALIWGSKDEDRVVVTQSDAKESMVEQPPREVQDSTYLFEFDPNTATLRELRRLGLSKEVAISLIRYRSAGKVFRIKEEVSECYLITDSTYYAIEPYIKIGVEYQYPKREPKRETETITTWKEREYQSVSQNENKKIPLSKFLLDTVGVEYLCATGVLSRRQAEVFVDWHKLGGMYNMRELRECYVVSPDAANKLEEYVIFPERKVKLVDINKADSAELRGVRGIGEKSVVAIMDYRKQLGGFYSISQLSELYVVTELNFKRIITQISCDSCDISKIDINFAVAKKLLEHPYISRKAVRRLLKTRQIKGGWSSIVEMTEDNIFTHEEAERLRPYIVFGTYTKPKDI